MDNYNMSNLYNAVKSIQGEFNQAIERLIKVIERKNAEFYTRCNIKNLPDPKISTVAGKRYVKIVISSGPSTSSVHCFVDKTNGNVLKAASWKSPAKHSRANIFDAQSLESGLTAHGAAYLK